MNVLLLPRKPTAESVAALLSRWSAAGLLHPFCVWQAADPEPVPTVTRIANGKAEEMVLGDALAAAHPEEIEFVAFYPLAIGEAAEPGFSDLVERFLAWVWENALDLNTEQLLSCALVIAPGAPDQAVPPELFRARLVNLLVAPEDRAGPGAVNQLQDRDGNGGRFVRHAAHAAATTAALWSTPLPQRPDLLAQMDERAGPLQVKVQVLRCFSRIVELGHIADHIAAVAFEPRGGWPRPGTDFDRPEDVARVVRGAAAAYLKRHDATLGRRRFEEVREDEPEPLGLLAALRALIEQFVAFARRRPSEIVEEAVGRLHRKAALRIEELDGTGKIRVRPWEEQPEGSRGLEPLCTQLDERPFVVEDGAVSDAWRELWQVTLGLVDGSDLPEEVAAWARGAAGRRLVVSDPGRIARDPEAGEETLHQPLLQQIRAGVEAARAAAAARAKGLERPDESEPRPQGGDEEPKPWWRPGRWLLGGGWFVALLRRVVLSGLLTLLAIAVAWAALPLLIAGGATLLILGGGLLAIAELARRAFNRQLVREDMDAARELRRLNCVLERAQALGDVERLSRRLKELDTWIAILSELVHRPWVRQQFEGLDLVRTTDEEMLPAACSVAVARSGRDLLERVGARARAATFTPGWLSSVYRRVEELAMEDYHLERGGLGSPPDPTEVSHDEESPQRALLAAVRAGEGRCRRDNPMAGELLQAIDAAPLDDLAPEVVPASVSVRPLAPTATWIAPPPGVAAVARERSSRLVGLRGWKTTGMVVAPGIALTAAAAVERGVVAVASADGEPVEVTEMRLPAGTGLALLSFDAEGEPEVETQVGRPRAGTGVVALEATAAGARARWGYVIGEPDDPTIVYDGGVPAAGSPVIDLQTGSLVAVQDERGLLLAVPEIADLLVMATEEEVPEATNGSAPGGDGGEPAGVPTAASGFLAGIATGNGAGALLPTYWAEPGRTNTIELALPPSLSAMDVSAPIGELSDGASFLRPLRVMVHRVEVTEPVEPDELAACRTATPVG